MRNLFQRGADTTVPVISEIEHLKKLRAPEENTIFDLTPPPTLLMNPDTSQIYKLKSH